MFMPESLQTKSGTHACNQEPFGSSTLTQLGPATFLPALMASQASLEKLWKAAPDGRLSALEQLKVVAMRDVQVSMDGEANMAEIARRATLAGEDGGNPSREAVRLLLEKVDGDSGWFPGKSYQTKRGPKPLLNQAKRRQLADSAMAAKKRGEEPTPKLLAQSCPGASRNPLTKVPFTAQTLRRVLKEDCYDNTPDHPWRYQRCLQKTWLPEQLRDERLAYACDELRSMGPPVWYFNNVTTSRFPLWSTLAENVCFSNSEGPKKQLPKPCPYWPYRRVWEKHDVFHFGAP